MDRWTLIIHLVVITIAVATFVVNLLALLQG